MKRQRGEGVFEAIVCVIAILFLLGAANCSNRKANPSAYEYETQER